MTNKLPSPDEIMETHEEIEEEYDLKFRGVRVAAPRIKLKRLIRGVAEHDDVYMRAGQLLRDLVTSHYFEDANKRTAWLTTFDYLNRHGESPAKTAPDDVEKVLKAIRAYDADEIAEWLESGEIDESRFNP